MGFLGYKRPDGKCGTRNHVMVLSSVSCANGVVNAIGREVPEVKPVTHPEGCGRGIADVEITGAQFRALGRAQPHDARHAPSAEGEPPSVPR